MNLRHRRSGGRRRAGSRMVAATAFIGLAVALSGTQAAVAATQPAPAHQPHSALGLAAAQASALGTTHRRPLRITTKKLVPGVKGLSYLQILSASGGTAPYAWKASGLPRGLTVSRGGVIKGYPRVSGTRTVKLRVRDARHRTGRRKLRLRIPSALPSGCVARSCARLSKDGATRQVPASDIGSVTRDPESGKVTTVDLTGITVSQGDVLVLAPTTGIPSGLIAVVNTVASTGGTATVGVTTASPADAYYQGIVQALGRPGKADHGSSRVVGAPNADLSCKGGVTSDLHGLTVTPSLTPDVSAVWKHRRRGIGGFFPGSGGLSLFQFGLTGTIKVDLGVSVSGKATCKLDLPSFDKAVPAGDLGVVLLQADPSLTLKTTAAVDVRTSVTLACTIEYRWSKGTTQRVGYCTENHQPLKLSAGSGVDATTTGAIDLSATLDDLPGIKGTIDASLHAGYHPVRHPIGQIDAESDYELSVTLANLWKHAPSHRLAHGTLFDKVLATYDRRPPGVGGGPSISVSPSLAYPWSNAVCGFDGNSTLPNTFTVNGRGYRPAESVKVSTGWKDYSGHQTADENGRFSVTHQVGEVPSADYTDYGVTASGNAGSRASSVIELDSDGCIHPIGNGVGNLTDQWGGNGFDPGTALVFSVDGEELSSTTTNSGGSGSSTADFTCPSSGDYTWTVSGTDDGHSEQATNDAQCTSSDSRTHRLSSQFAAGAHG